MPIPEQKPTARGAVAGLMLLAALLLCGAIGTVAGLLTGALAIGLPVGVLIGFVTGVAAVRARFPDL